MKLLGILLMLPLAILFIQNLIKENSFREFVFIGVGISILVVMFFIGLILVSS